MLFVSLEINTVYMLLAKSKIIVVIIIILFSKKFGLTQEIPDNFKLFAEINYLNTTAREFPNELLFDADRKMMIIASNFKPTYLDIYKIDDQLEWIQRVYVKGWVYLDNSFFYQQENAVFIDVGRSKAKFVKIDLDTYLQTRVSCEEVPRGCEKSKIIPTKVTTSSEEGKEFTILNNEWYILKYDILKTEIFLKSDDPNSDSLQAGSDLQETTLAPYSVEIENDSIDDTINFIPSVFGSIENIPRGPAIGAGFTGIYFNQISNDDYNFFIHDFTAEYQWSEEIQNLSVGYGISLNKKFPFNMFLIGASYQLNKVRAGEFSGNNFSSIKPELSFQLFTIAALRVGYQIAMDREYSGYDQFKIKFIISPTTLAMALWPDKNKTRN